MVEYIGDDEMVIFLFFHKTELKIILPFSNHMTANFILVVQKLPMIVCNNVPTLNKCLSKLQPLF